MSSKDKVLSRYKFNKMWNKLILSCLNLSYILGDAKQNNEISVSVAGVGFEIKLKNSSVGIRVKSI